MTITSVFSISLACVLIIHFLVLPGLRKAVRGGTGVGSIKPYAAFHLFCILRTVALAVLLGAAVIALMTWNYNTQTPASAEEATVLLVRMRGLRDAAVAADTGLTIFVILVLIGGLCWLTYTQARQKAEGLLTSILKEEYQRVLDVGARGEWEPLPATKEMREIETFLNRDDALLEAAKASNDMETVAKLEKEIETLRMHYVHADTVRRMNMESNALDEDLILPVSASRIDRLRNLLVNRGVLKTLKGGARFAAFVALVTLLPASVAFNLATAADGLAARYVELDALRVKLAVTETERQVRNAVLHPPAVTPLPVPDDTAEENIVNTYDQSFNNYVLARSIALPARLQLTRNAVREQILHDLASTTPHVTVVTGPAENTDDVFALARQQFREQVHAIRENNKAAWNVLKASFPATTDFGTPVTRSELRQALIGEVTRSAFGNAGEDLVAAYHGHANEVLSATLKGVPARDAIKKSFEHKEAFWTAQANHKLDAIQQKIDIDGNPVDKAMRENPPTLRTQPPPTQTVAEVENVLQNMPEGERQAAALFGYDDLLPGRLGDEGRTSAANIANRLAQRGNRQLSPVHIAQATIAKESAIAFNRSFSYRSLRGFSRVGGVLIGRPPEDEKGGANITEVTWAYTKPSAMTLTLTSADGGKRSFGPYPVSLVRHALAYAADQRPLAVTMISGEPVPDLKIIAHPSLIDTAVGCRAIQLDRFADEASSRAPYRSNAEDVARANNTLYGMAWGTALAQILSQYQPDGDNERSRLENLLSRANEKIDQAARELPENTKALRSVLGNADESPTKSKPQFYNAELVQIADQCVQSSDTLANVQRCIKERPYQTINLETLLSQIPEFQIWSGVRELPYQIDANLNFLRPATGNVLWPFDFVLQTAFTRRGLIDSGEIIDETPWEFPFLHERLVRDVGKLVTTDKSHASVISDMRNFTILQRMFRAALAGQLGSRFPLDRLTKLSYELKTRATPSTGYKTPRWNTNFRVDAYFAKSIQTYGVRFPIQNAEIKGIVNDLPHRIMACAEKRIAQAKAGRDATVTTGDVCDLRTFSTRAQTVEADTNSSETERALARKIKSMVAVLTLRSTLGVFNPENLNPPTCPAL